MIDFYIKIILAISQVIFNFTFELCAICGNHFGELLWWVLFMISVNHIYQKMELNTTFYNSENRIFMQLNPYFSVRNLSNINNSHIPTRH